MCHSSLSSEIDRLIISLGGLPPSPAVARLEREIAFLVWVMKHQRMTSLEAAIYHNGLAIRSRCFGPPVYSLHTRLEDLTEELGIWLSALRM